MDRRHFYSAFHSILFDKPTCGIKQILLKGRVLFEALFLVRHEVKEIPKGRAFGCQVNLPVHPKSFLADIGDAAKVFGIVVKIHAKLSASRFSNSSPCFDTPCRAVSTTPAA
jgi:hypothetical protein